MNKKARRDEAVWKRLERPRFDWGLLLSCDCSFEVDGPQEVVGEDGECHLGSGALEVPGEETASSRHPFDGAEWMLGGASSHCHEGGVGPRIHPVESVLIQMTLDESSWGRGAVRLEGAARAVERRVGDIALLPVEVCEPACGLPGSGTCRYRPHR